MARTPIEATSLAGLSAVPSMEGIEAATQSFKKGAPVIISAGSLAIAAANPRSIIGFAEEAASGVTGAKRRIVPALPHVIFEGSLESAAALGTLALTQAHIWAEVGITVDGAGLWYLDIDKVTGGTNTVARIIAAKDAIGTIVGRVQFILLNEVSVFQT